MHRQRMDQSLTTPASAALPERPLSKSPHTPRPRAPGVCALLWLLVASCALAAGTDETSQQLKQADAIKLRDYPRFAQILHSLQEREPQLAPAHREYLDYLQGWNSVYTGNYATAITQLSQVADKAADPTLQFRATNTIVNVLTLSRRYEEAFARLNRLLEMLPKVTDGEARQQALLVAAFTYVEVGQYDLTLNYAQMVIDENWAGKGACKGGQLKLEAQYRSGRVTTDEASLAGSDACRAAGEVSFANTIRTYAAKLYIAQHRYDDAIDLLKQNYGEVVRSRYRRLISEYDSLLAQAYQRKGTPALAQQFSLDTIQNAVPNEYSEPLVNAYATLYELAKNAGDYKAALSYHEQYAIADKGYLDDVSARHLAYQKITHENIANKLQLDALNRENRVLQLQRQLTAKVVETSRLYIALLGLGVLFLGLWAYRTKRLQLHFMTLSRLDGLTGICNRPHFITQAQRALDTRRTPEGAKARDQACIVLCDLDHFKTINDRHGHATGDYVLKRVVAACQQHLHPHDIFGRFGGEEFAFVFPACGPAEARRRSEVMRVAISAVSTKVDDVELVVSASFGVAATASSGHELRQLLAHADSALYEAKRAGRNRVMMHEGEVVAAPPNERIRDVPDGKRILAR
jgi:diguanylate cyclase (GGDEF)-like protein